MDTCTNVPDMCRKEKQRVRGERKGRRHPRETAWKQGEPTQWGWDSLLFRTRAPPEGTVALRMTSIHLRAERGFLSILWHPGLDKRANAFCQYVPLKSVFTLRPEIVDVGLEMQFEDVVLVDVFRLRGDGDWVTQQRQAGQRVIILREEIQLTWN